MARIAFLLLCHKDPEAVIRQAQSLTAVGDYAVIHYDRRAPAAEFRRLEAALGGDPNIALLRRRVACGWGAWSLVEATLRLARTGLAAFPRASHFYLLSGDCMTIKSAEYAHAFLDRRACDYIESVDYFTSGWIKTGWRDERLIYRHVFNERRHRRLFYAAYEVQKRLGLRRRVPDGLEMMIGSQWWCLRRATLTRILDFAAARRDVLRFFRTTWIPDETFFQTLVRHLVPAAEIESRTPTFLLFTDYGMPVNFHNDHYDFLVAQDYLFARKISPEAQELKRRLGVLYAAEGTRFEVSGGGPALHAFLTGQGRRGRRHAPRFWETESSLGRDRDLLILVCKKWHVGKRLVGLIRDRTGLPCYDYLFDEEATPLPDLGGLQTSLEKRHRHRRALLRMLYDAAGSTRLVICIDPGSFALLEDFARGRAETRILEIDCAYDDGFLRGHAERTGLIGARSPAATVAELLPALRREFLHQTDRIRSAGFAHLWRLRQGAPVHANAEALAGFLGLGYDCARKIAERPNLFND
ncbi:DUF5928 domain-containing protein [Roseivivax sp. CAU 1761]